MIDTDIRPHDIGWQGTLAEGRAGEALRQYLALAREGEAGDAGTGDALDLLARIQEELRAKRFSRALARLRRERDGLPALLSWEALAAQMETLEAANKELDRRDSDAALARLDGVDLAVLEAEKDTLLGTAYIFQNDVTRAEACFERALARDPKHYRAQTNRGNLALEAGRIDEAVAAYEAALKLNQNFANAHHNLGVAYRRKGQINRSVSAIRTAQRVGRRHDAEEARDSFKNMRVGGGRTLRYALWAVGAVLIFLLLRSQGIF